MLSTRSARAVDLSIDLDVSHTITPTQNCNRTTLIYHNQMIQGNHGGLGQPANGYGGTNPQMQYWTVSVTYKVGGAVPVLYASLGLKRNSSQPGYADTQYMNGTYVVLSPGQSNSTTFMWYENGVDQIVLADYAQDGTSHSGTQYSIICESWPLTGTETNPADNIVVAQPNPYWNASCLRGDIYPDGVVNIYDGIRFANAFGRNFGGSGYNSDANLSLVPDPETGLQTIDIFDAIVFAGIYGANFYRHVP